MNEQTTPNPVTNDQNPNPLQTSSQDSGLNSGDSENTNEGSGVGEPSTSDKGSDGKAPATNADGDTGLKPEEGKGDEPESKVPEKYEFKTPEGAPEVNQEFFGLVGEIAKELNLSNEQGQKIIDKAVPFFAARQQDVMETTKAQWWGEVKSNPEFGGDKLQESKAIAGKGFSAFSKKLQELFSVTGLNHHPDLFAYCYARGKELSEDTSFAKGDKGTSVQSLVDRLHPTLAKE